MLRILFLIVALVCSFSAVSVKDAAFTRDCLVKQKSLADKTSYSAFCGDEVFFFEKVNGKYLFTSITPND